MCSCAFLARYISGLQPRAQGKVKRAVVTVHVEAAGGHTDGRRVGEPVVTCFSLERPALSFQGNCLVHLHGGPGSYHIVAVPELEGSFGERWGAGGEGSGAVRLLVRVAPG